MNLIRRSLPILRLNFHLILPTLQHFLKCAKLHRSGAIVGLVGLVPPCHCAFMGPKFFLVGISWVLNFFSWVFHGSEIFPRGCFVGPKFFLVGISRVQNFFSRIFCGSKIFSRGYFVGPKVFS